MSQEKLPASLNMVLFDKPFSLTKEDLEDAAKAHGIQDFSFTTDEHPEDAFVVFANGLPFMIMNVQQPVPRETFDEVLKFSFGTDNGEEIVAKQQAHIIISPLVEATEMGHGVSGAIGVTDMSALVARIKRPVGHYWSHSDTLFSQKQFEECYQNMLKAMEMQRGGGGNAAALLPFMFWVGFRLIGTAEAGKFGAQTKGLSVFTGYELEIAPVKLSPETLANRIYGTVQYLFNTGPVLQDGQSLGVTESEHFRLVWCDKAGDQPAKFLLTLETGRA